MSKYAGFDLYDRDENLEKEEGVEVPFGDDVSIRIRRAGGANTKYARVFGQVIKPYRRQMDAGKLEEKKSTQLHAQVYARSVVVGWKGIKDADTGEDVPFTEGEVEAFLIAMPEVFQVLRDKAEAMDTFRREEIEGDVEDLGNS
ncbi:MAG: hypothetical protein DRJ15_16520 [Bacteroidetes bacterium]|nr:MAG: hypothetical protein DRJ15_16520 [Bacteroidota bacterium]